MDTIFGPIAKVLAIVFLSFIQLIPTDGLIRKHAHVRTGRYHQVCVCVCVCVCVRVCVRVCVCVCARTYTCMCLCGSICVDVCVGVACMYVWVCFCKPMHIFFFPPPPPLLPLTSSLTHTQHLHEYLDLDMSALHYMMKCYPEEKEEEQMRRSLGRYGLTGKQQVGVHGVDDVYL